MFTKHSEKLLCQCLVKKKTFCIEGERIQTGQESPSYRTKATLLYVETNTADNIFYAALFNTTKM